MDLPDALTRGQTGIHPFDDDYFDWWSSQIIAIEDYPYTGIDFSRDPDMAVPPGSRIGAISMYFCIFKYFEFFFYIYAYIYSDILFF